MFSIEIVSIYCLSLNNTNIEDLALVSLCTYYSGSCASLRPNFIPDESGERAAEAATSTTGYHWGSIVTITIEFHTDVHILDGLESN